MKLKKSERTRKKIIDCFYALNADPSNKLCTVSEICEEMDISVSTFYCHFSGIKDILEEESARLTSNVSEAIGKIHDSGRLSSGGFVMTRERMLSIIRLAQAKRRENLLLMRPDLDLPYRAYLKSLVIQGVSDALFSLPETQKSYVVEFLTTGVLFAMDKWLREQDMSPEAFVDILFTLEDAAIQTAKRKLSALEK